MRKLQTIQDYLAYGNAVVTRLAALPAVKELKAPIATFKKIHATYVAAARVVEAAKKKRDRALAEVGARDDVLDGALDDLASAMVGAKMGSRQNPFRGYSSYPPGEMVDLPYAVEVKEARSLADNVEEAEPPKEVAKHLGICRKAADGVEEALSALSVPQAEYDRAISARDKLLPDWNKALTVLRKKADAVWTDEPEVAESLFAPPEAVQRPVRKQKPRAAKGKDGAAKPTRGKSARGKSRTKPPQTKPDDSTEE